MPRLEAFTNWLYDNVRPVYDLIRPLKTFYLNYFVEKTHVYETGVPIGSYADPSTRLSATMRLAYVKFVETQVMSLADEDETPVEVLKWHEKHNNMPHAADVYVYITKRRDELVDLERTLLSKAVNDLDDDTTPMFNDTYMPTYRAVEEHLHEMDQRCLHRIVDLIPWMWT